MRKYNKYLISILIFLILSFSLSQDSFALELESKYFNTTINEGVSSQKLLKELLELRYFLDLDAPHSSSSPDVTKMINSTLDTLYLAVSNILGIHIYNFKVNLVILPDKEGLSKILVENGVDIESHSYYYYQKNTIYVSFADLRLGVLAHEVSRAIISHYFVVPPPENIQEILSGYIEYSITQAIEKD